MSMEKLDYKKQNKDLYLPKQKPAIIEVPTMNFIMVDGCGNPNTEDGEYSQAVELLYGLSYTIKMSIKNGYEPEGYFEYVVPPLEGLWWLDNSSMNFTEKNEFKWTSMIRQPEFVTTEVFSWACEELHKKKPKLDISKAFLKSYNEGLCVQIMHVGPFDDEQRSIDQIKAYIKEMNLKNAISSLSADGIIKRHHEIYLSDPRKTSPEKMKTVIRHPIFNK